MVPLPRFLRHFRQEAQECLGAGGAKEVEFSRGTYQILVDDGHSEAWAFLQFDDKGRLNDCFCSCHESELHRGCLHQAVAFLCVFSTYSQPLHCRFHNSLWNILCRICADRVGTELESVQVESDGFYHLQALDGKTKFSVQTAAQNADDQLKEIFFCQREETEETSIKFSNLTEEEMFLWDRGKLSSRLKYELSFWNSLAKWLLEQQEVGQPYTITFIESENHLPTHIKAEFSSFSASWEIPEELFSEVIPALTTVHSSLAVYDLSISSIKAITYDGVEKRFEIDLKPSSERVPTVRGSIEIGDWIYVPHRGFYSKKPHLPFSTDDLSDPESSLIQHRDILSKYGKNFVVHETPVNMLYWTFFDDEWSLHIQSYLFVPGDLELPQTAFFGSWIYLENKGFYEVDRRDEEPEAGVVPFEAVADFVHHHRSWLNTQEGFHVHVSAVETAIGYHMTDDGGIFFSSNETQDLSSKEFGRWIYIQGEGFFPKTKHLFRKAIVADTYISPSRLPLFIQEHDEELQAIPHFFSSQSPIENVVLDIVLNDDEEVVIVPNYELRPEYQDQQIRYFEDYTFVEGEGFCPFPESLGVPKCFRIPFTVSKERLSIFLEQELSKLQPFVRSIDPRLHFIDDAHLVAANITHGQQGDESDYSLSLHYQTNVGSISILSLWQALQQHKRFVFSDAGVVDLEQQRFHWLRQVSRKKIDQKQGTVDLSALELLRLNAASEIQTLDHRSDTVKILRDLTEFRAPEEPNLKGLKSKLRAYQHKGVLWLWFLYHHSLSGLLCDDMGLGKTHQAMALFAAVVNFKKRQQGSAPTHFLVVCPTSVMYHWQEKLQQYLPHLRVLTFHGANRDLTEFYHNSDILLTSYGIWRNEVHRLSELSFEVAVFDELQIAKNQTSRIYHALLKTRARVRLGMTGTPMENRLRELKALFDIVLPSYMPSDQDYRRLFINPIEKEGDLASRQLLSRFVKPFILRRKKEEVLTDLPEKIEEVAHCDLLSTQHQLYLDVLMGSQAALLHQLESDSTPIPYLHIFSLLSKLKQICNHPATYFKKPEEYKHYQSGKWDLFVELLEEARASKQKVVVFSQYLAMIEIIELYLKEKQIGYAIIKGATTNRGQMLERFSKDPDCEVFIGSLQAAGLGVDLTAGSVVIHYDRWWNAARENQATDRVHRIGQERGVQVFKLVTKQTLEEHIDFMIARKGKLLEEVVSVDDHQVLKQFDRQEMINLLHTLSREALAKQQK